jgi:hypothetical protein
LCRQDEVFRHREVRQQGHRRQDNADPARVKADGTSNWCHRFVPYADRARVRRLETRD